MDKKSRQQYRLKGATKILSDNQLFDQEPNKISSEARVDSTTSSNQLFNQLEPATTTIIDSCNNNNSISGNIQSTNLLSISSDSVDTHNNNNNNNPTSLASASSSSYNLHQQSTILNQQQQQQLFGAPQFLPCDIKSLFECPICFDYAIPPIYQCQNGHLVCQGCSSKITHCPNCRVPMSEPSIRNLQLDRLANTFQFPCKYNYNGCQWKSYWFNKKEHEENCDYISYPCPCPGTACKWTGLLTQVMPHLSEHHKSITTLSGEDIVFLATDINLKGAVDWVMIQSCFNHHFLLVLEKQESKTGQQQFFAIVQLIGSQREAENFRYKLELSSNVLGQVKRLHWEATPRSILDGIQSAISAYDCLVFDQKTVKHFLSPIQKDKDSSTSTSQAAGGDAKGENLGINVTIDRLI